MRWTHQNNSDKHIQVKDEAEDLPKNERHMYSEL